MLIEKFITADLASNLFQAKLSMTKSENALITALIKDSTNPRQRICSAEKSSRAHQSQDPLIEISSLLQLFAHDLVAQKHKKLFYLYISKKKLYSRVSFGPEILTKFFAGADGSSRI